MRERFTTGPTRGITRLYVALTPAAFDSASLSSVSLWPVTRFAVMVIGSMKPRTSQSRPRWLRRIVVA